MKKLFFLLIIVWVLPVFGYAQDDAFVFTHLKEADGLANNIVNCIFKARNNKLWIGTYNGFNSYDGSNFYPFKLRKGANSLPNEVVHSLCEDREGNIWGATNNGVFCYNPAKDQYTNYTRKDSWKSADFNNILCDKNGNIWAANAYTVFKFNKEKNQLEEKLLCANPADTSQYYYISKNGLQEEPGANRLWITTAGGLWYYDYENNKAGNDITEQNNPLLKKRKVAALHKAANGHFWFFDNDAKAIIQFDPVLKKELRQIPVASYLPNASGATIFEDSNNRLWFSSWTYEVLVIDLAKSNQVQQLIHRNDDSRSIAGNFFWAGYEDADNTVWLGTVAGISRCNPEKLLYKEYRIADYINELKSSTIQLVEQDTTDNNFWIVTSAGDLLHCNPVTGKAFEKFSLQGAVKNKNGQLPGYCTAIKIINGKTVITTPNGIWQPDGASKRLIPFNGLPKGYEDFAPIEMVPDGDAVMWFNNGKQVLYWNKLLSKTQLYSFAGAKAPELIFGSCISNNHALWLMSSNKTLVEISNGSLQERKVNGVDLKDPGLFWSLLPDAAGNLWILNRGSGIYHYNTATQNARYWNATDGMAGNRMQEITMDRSGSIWSMLYGKVSVLVPAVNEVYNFNIQYAEDDLGYDNHLTRLANGNILGTIKNELVEFFPDRLKMKPVLEKPIIGQLKTKTTEVNEFDGTVILLNTDENTIGVKFGCLISRQMFPYELEYKLTGGNNEWAPADGDEVILTNLAPGKYTFKVRARGKNNAWQTEEAAISFVIKTPFLRTIWFKLALLLLVAAAAYLFYRYRVKQKDKLILLESKAQLLEKEKALVMYENLKQHLNPHFLFNSLTSLRSLIRLNQDMAGNFLDKMSKVYRYILKNRDNEVVPLSEEIKFVEMYIALQKTRFENGLQVHIEIEEEYYHRKIAPVTLQNLVENAIKHNTADEDAPLVIKLFVEDDYLVVQNNLQKKNFVETSNRMGLANMESLYRFLCKKPMLIIENENYFTVKIPLI